MESRNKLRSHYDNIFEKYSNDEIMVHELAKMLRTNKDISEILVQKLIKANSDNKINMKQFSDIMLAGHYKAFFGRYVNSYVNLLVPRDKRHHFKPVGRTIRPITELDAATDGSYEDGFTCCPPPLCMVTVSILEIICYVLNEYLDGADPNSPGTGPTAQHLIFDPQKRQQCWRFLTYMFVHIGSVHIITNLIIQIFLGLALELRNSWWRVLTVYTAGVVAGSLVTSIVDPRVYLAGASGGVYAIITSHLSNVIMNWSEMSFPAVQFFVILLLISADVATSIHNRYFLGNQTPIGYAAHFGGALAGFLVGIWVLKNVEPTEKEKYLWWAAMVLYILLMGSAIMLNIFWKQHFLPTVWNRSSANRRNSKD
ncbi:unnamed protein product [Ceutorhynchus assimilis]|uniref:Peptidase S54 rhomboid domain-containing protein n=1 Tax=Ceutorhynchus assimilis TaxID=467358 RepID=A0A9N9MZI8_9CUCU|nr:unnamed protein product [Ceutorhynchus assimilis]